MIEFIKRIWRKLFAKPKTPKIKKARRGKEHFGSHYYLGDLLDSLDHVFSDLPAIKRCDREAYSVFSKFGATVFSSDVLLATKLEPHVVQSMPTFGCFYSTPKGGENSDSVPFRFSYFQKMKRPINVQPHNGAVYRCVMTYHLHKIPFACQFYVGLNENGDVTPLKVLEPRRYGSRGKRDIIRMEWALPSELCSVAVDNGEDAEEMAKSIFATIANASAYRESGLTVRVRKDNLSAAFAIDVERTPYFFANREKTITENGNTKPIFHIVRGHWRAKAGGDRKWIKSHFRGVRDFVWNGYKIKISMAGRNAVGLSSLNISGVDALEDGRGYIGSDELAERLDGMMA